MGVFAGYNGNSYGLGIEASGQVGKGKENSHSTTQVNTQLNGQKVSISSQGNTNLQGAEVNAKRLEGDIKGNLLIESRQDESHYEAKQSQAGASASFTIYGSGGGASASFVKNSAKANQAQVQTQSGFNVGEDGLKLNVQGNTHLKGGVIQSSATKDKNHFSTGTLTSENYSEVEIKSVSGGASTNMATMGAMVMGSMASALANKSESDHSTTQSAVGNNINLIVKNGEIPTALSRDTEKANQKVSVQDINKLKANQEAAQLIGEIANKQIDLTLGSMLTEAQATFDNSNASQGAKATAQQNIKEYGIGSDYQLAIRAVTGVLQGLVTGDTNAAVMGGLSPYANQFIKNQTQGNDSANLMAHALLGAVEAQATGNNALAGAVAGATGEAAANIIAQKLYQKSADKLTEAEKKNVSALSQVASGLAAGLTGDSFASAAAGVEIGKRAVENNSLLMDNFRKDVKEDISSIKEKVRNGLGENGMDWVKILLHK